MPRASANHKIMGVITGPSTARRERGADKAVIPWKEMERRVAEQIAAKAVRKTQSGRSDVPSAPQSARGGRTQSGRSDIPPWKQNPSPSGSIRTEDPDDNAETVVNQSIVEDPPQSGVRMGEVGLPAARPLTFTVYSVEELDARQRVAASVPPPSTPAPPPSRWPEVWRSTQALIRTWRAWYKTPAPRPRMMTTCGVALATLRVDLFAALQQLPWRKIAIRGGIGFASAFLLLFVVMIAADMTDDLKPGATHASAANVETTSAVEAKPEATEAEEAPAIELDDEATPADKKPAVSTKKAGGKKKSKKDVFNP